MSNLITRVRDNSKKYPERIAFVDDSRSMSFAELWTESGKVAAWLKGQGMGKEDFCLIVLPRCASSMSSILGVLRAGCAFCNLDSKYPAERIMFIRYDLGAKCVIDEETYAKIQAEVEPMDGWVAAEPHDAAFAVYTSGSTGRPKGVLHEYGNIDLCLSLYPEQEEYEELHSCLTAPFYSVASVLLAFNTMAVARTTHIVSELMLRDLRGMSKFLIDNQIADTFLPPSYIKLYPEPSPYLRNILTGAENADGVYYEGGKPSILNYYSMTEAGFPLLIWQIDRKYDKTPVGVPVVPGIDLHIIDEDGKRIEGPGEGEVCFNNRFVRGYINLPEQTAEVFKDGVFHTGDIARRDENGIYYYVCRADDMVKISGNRVEPGEVEAVFRQVTGIQMCCAKGFEDRSGAFICMYYQGQTDMDKYEIREAMAKSLPEYMIPTYFVQLEKMPLMIHGKIDRKVLEDPRGTKERPVYVAPADEIEEKLCGAIGKVLNIDKVGALDDFFELGGSSIAAIEVVVVADIEGLSAIDIYKGHTVRGIADLYRERAGVVDGLTPAEREENARKQVLPLTLPQEVVIRRQEFNVHSNNHLYPFIVSVSKLISAKHLVKAVHTIMLHHAVFGTVFSKDEEGNYYQRYDASAIKLPEVEKISADELAKIMAGPFEAFDLYNEPLVRVRIFKCGLDLKVLFVFHHLIFDGSSLQLMGDNFMKAFLGKELETDTYFTYVADETGRYKTEEYTKAKEYFDNKFSDGDWCWDIPHDNDAPGYDCAIRNIPTKLTLENLADAEKRFGKTRQVMCSAALFMTLAELSGNSKVLISSFFHGRTDEMRKHAVGLVAAHIAGGVDLSRIETLADLYAEIEKESNEGIAHSLYDWCAVNADPYVRDAIDFIYQTPEIINMDLTGNLGAKIEDLDPHWDMCLKLSYLYINETPSDVSVELYYTSSLMSEEMIDRFSAAYARYIETMLFAEDPSQIMIRDLLTGITD